jgi:outer membrane protein assembly factor BamB
MHSQCSEICLDGTNKRIYRRTIILSSYKGERNLKKHLISLMVLFLLISTVTPMILAQTDDAPQKESYDAYFPHSYFARYNPDECTLDNTDIRITSPSITDGENENRMQTLSDGLMDSPWPMYCHDTRHTGRSPYSTVNATGVVKWRAATHGPAYGGPTIDNDGIIYIGSYDLNAIYPNGTLKWKYPAGHSILCAPAIAQDGTIYFGVIYGNGYLYALNPDGTVKWTYPTGGDLDSSPVIGDDGTIYVGSGSKTIHAIHPNGTRKWVFNTNHVVLSSPAIGPDGTIYCGSHDTYLYALYPENGTLKWKYKTGDWIRVSPCIADDGTIYVVSFDCNIHAVNPNGTMKWKTYLGQAGTSPTIGLDGTIYCGYRDLYAINPENGSVKWVYDVPGTVEGGTPCSSIDGTIYLGTWEGGYLIAVNPDGTEQWRKKIGDFTDSPPAIGADGTVYIGSHEDAFYAFGKGLLWVEANGPYNGYAHSSIQFGGTIYGGVLPYSYQWDFGDGTTSTEQNPKHAYDHRGNYTATFTVTDAEGNSSSDTALVVVDYALPTVSIVKPTNALYFMNIRILPTKTPYIIGRITIEVNASQEDGFEIVQVAFIIDDNEVASVTSKPYTWTWRREGLTQAPPHHIDIRAVDSLGHKNWATLYVWKLF